MWWLGSVLKGGAVVVVMVVLGCDGGYYGGGFFRFLLWVCLFCGFELILMGSGGPILVGCGYGGQL